MGPVFQMRYYEYIFAVIKEQSSLTDHNVNMFMRYRFTGLITEFLGYISISLFYAHAGLCMALNGLFSQQLHVNGPQCSNKSNSVN